MEQTPDGGPPTAAHYLAAAARFERLARASTGDQALTAELLAMAAEARAKAARVR